MIYFLIKNGVVVNKIVAEASFIATIENQYDYCIENDNNPGSAGVGWSYNGTSFSPPVSDVVPLTINQIYEGVVEAAMSFGQNMIVQFAAANIIAGITQSGKTPTLLSYAANLSQCLSSGSLYAAISEINAMIADDSSTKVNLSPFITNDILYTYLNAIQTYLGAAITPNPES